MPAKVFGDPGTTWTNDDVDVLLYQLNTLTNDPMKIDTGFKRSIGAIKMFLAPLVEKSKDKDINLLSQIQAGLRRNIEALRSELKSKDQELSELQRQVGELNQNLAEGQEELAQVKAELERKDAQLAQKIVSSHALDVTVNQQVMEILALQTKADALNSKVEEQERQADNWKKKAEGYHQSLAHVVGEQLDGMEAIQERQEEDRKALQNKVQWMKNLQNRLKGRMLEDEDIDIKYFDTPAQKRRRVVRSSTPERPSSSSS